MKLFSGHIFLKLRQYERFVQSKFDGKETLLKDVSKNRPECTDLLDYFPLNITDIGIRRIPAGKS
jgi:hypothetical protein